MKLRILVCLCFILAAQLKAQGSLQFNQVVSHSGTGSGTFSYTSPTWTVPANKVWKIEAAAPFAGMNTSHVTRTIQVNSGNAWGAYSLLSGDPTPIWLKAGDQVRLEASANCCNTYPFSYHISILEFNIIP
ncbi:MAG: hypothetical protein O3C46_04005 [Bacteroidetes bacterium]|jgi:hypothetical protein|nr:hypothetical protein [Bacteroidota bacterium]